MEFDLYNILEGGLLILLSCVILKNMIYVNFGKVEVICSS